MQVSLVPALEIGPARPQLVLTWVIGWAVVRGRGEAVLWAIFAGLLLDLLSQMPLGAHLLALTAVAFMADLGHRVMHGSTALFAAVAVAAGSLGYGLILLLALTVTGHAADLASSVTSAILPGAAYNLALLIPIFAIQRAIDRRFPVSVLPEW